MEGGYAILMTANGLLDEALKLPLQEREELCARLWDSLQESESTSSLLAEMQRRITHADEHPEELVDWEDFKAEVLAARGLKL
jgi:putative addiction module component (TIGR02574 family)